MQTDGKMTAANVNYKMNRRLIFKWHERFQNGRESLEDDSRSGRTVNLKWHNLAQSLMDACIKKGTIRCQEMGMTSNIFKQLWLTSV